MHLEPWTPHADTDQLRRRVDLIVIHHSATPDGRWVSSLDVNQWHKERGFARQEKWRQRQNRDLGSIGYHFVLYTNGAIATGRHLEEPGAHVKGHNATSIGICLIGDREFTMAQWASLASCMHSLIRWEADRRGVKHGVRQDSPVPAVNELAGRMGLEIRGHKDLAPTLCPGFEVGNWLAGDMGVMSGHLWEGK